MNNFRFLILQIFVPLFLCGILSAQVPAGGTMMNATTGTTYQKIGSGTVTEINVTGQPFTTGLRIVIGANIPNFYSEQIQFPTVTGIAVNDVVLVAFYARTISSIQETGEGALTVVIENNTTYSKELSTKITIGSTWKQYYASAKCVSTLSATQVRYAFQTGYPSQTIEIADVKFLNYKTTLTVNDLPITEITYVGQAADAVWRIPAQERINQIRKGKIEMVVYDEMGQLVNDAGVSIEMVRHKFGFGTAIPASTFLTNTVFRNKVYELFNEVVFENDLKWPQFNPASTLNLRKSLDSLDKRKIPVRGHNVIWPSWKWCPTSLKTLEKDTVALRIAIDKRIDEVTQFTKGRLNDWDVINEPYSEHEIMDILGNEVMADWLKRVRQNDREVKLYINDYGILSGGGLDIKKQDSYFNLINYLDARGAKVDGIGMQGHFSSDLTSITKVYSILERFSTLGKEIKITEHDINITQRAVQADYTRDFMTILFSHPSVKSIMVWGFWQGSHWRPDAAFFNTDWTIRPHGDVWKDLIYNQWWTKKTDSITNSYGKVLFEGFLGTYKYTIKKGNKERTGTFSIINSKQSDKVNTVVLSFDESIPDNFSISTLKPPILCEGETITLTAPSINGGTYQWYNGAVLLSEQTGNIVVSQPGVYSVKVLKGTLEIKSDSIKVTVNRIPAALITATGNLSFCPGGTLKLGANISNDLTYNWMKGTTKIQGSVTSINVSESGSYSLVTNASGCSAKSAEVNVQVYAANDPACTTGFNENQVSCRVYPNPFKGSFTIETSALNHEPATAELFNSMGQRVLVSELDKTSGKTTITYGTPGLYTLRISNHEDIRIFKIIGN